MLIAEFIKRDEPDNQRKTENYLTLVRTDTPISINKTVLETQAKMRREKKLNIPSTEDVKCLAKYLDRERKKCFTQLSGNYSYADYLKLSELTMSSIIVFNRRRTGETQNILVTDFTKRDFINKMPKTQLFLSLSDQAQKLLSQYSRMTVRGKKGRPVPVLLPPDIDHCVELLLFYRTTAGVSQQSKYLFELPTSSETRIKIIHAGYSLHKFANACGARDPTTLTGTNMRKHVASMCITMGLNDNLVSEVANFMGHQEKIHRDYYRHNTMEMEVVTLSPLLQTAQGNIDDDDSDESSDEDDVDDAVELIKLPPETSVAERDRGASHMDMQLDMSSSFLDDTVNTQKSDDNQCNPRSYGTERARERDYLDESEDDELDIEWNPRSNNAGRARKRKCYDTEVGENHFKTPKGK